MEANPRRGRRSKGAETCCWTTYMDEVLIDAYLHQQTLGNKNGNCMTSRAMNNISKELMDHFPNKPISKDKIKDHMKHIKTKFYGCYELFKNGLNGFVWDARTSMWIAEPEAWDKLIEAKPEAAKWRNKPILHYDKLAQLFGKDWVPGEHAKTAADIRVKRATSDGNGSDENLHNVDLLVSPNEATLEGFDLIDEEFQPFTSPDGSSDGNSHGATLSKTKKRAKRVMGKENNVSMGYIAKSLEKVVEVFDNLSRNIAELVKQNQDIAELAKQYQNSAADGVIWTQLEDIGVEPTLLPGVYMHLIQHPVALRAFNGVPVHRRKEMLPHIVPGYPSNI